MSRRHQLVREARPEPAPAPTPKAQLRPDPARRERPPRGEPRAFTPFFGCCGEAHEGVPRAPEQWCPGGWETHYQRDQPSHVPRRLTSLEQSSSQHPLHQCGMKPTLCDGDDLEEQDLLLGGEPRGPTPGPPGTIEHHGVLRCKRDKRALP